jgi:uncharacterized membrane protein YgdD (TMEM256/DUF423 family)
MIKLLLTIGALDAALAVILGAFGAHGLKDRVTAARLDVWHTACEYQFYHALGILLIVLLATHFSSHLLPVAWVLLAGSVIFSGSLYLLVLTDTAWLGAITPIGGMTLIVGWCILAWQVFRFVQV